MAYADYDPFLYKIPKNEILENRQAFYGLQRDSGESMEKWLDRVRICIVCCDFPKCVEYLLIDRFVCEINYNERKLFRSEEFWSVQKLNNFFKDQNDGIEHIDDDIKREPDDDYGISDIHKAGINHVNVIEEEVPLSPSTSHTQIGASSTTIVSEGDVGVNLIDGMKCEFEDYKYLVNGQVYESIDEMDHSVGSKPKINESTMKNVPENATKSIECMDSNAVHSDQEILEQAGEKQVTCDLCEKSFTRVSSLAQHKKVIHQGIRPYSCEVCGMSFSAPYRLKEHSVVHTGERPYNCDLCDWSFNHMYSLTQHKKEIHQGIRPYSCEMCGKQFSAPGRLKEHSVIHTGERPYKCDLCEKSFAQKSGLRKHNKDIHQGISPFSCEVCGKGFSTPRHLKKHSVAHIGAKPYKCDLCEMSFTQTPRLRKHKKEIHQGISPYSCEVCGKGFITPSALNQHSVVHTGAKPYKCDLCEKAFSHISSLLKHKKRIHKRLPLHP